MSFPWAIRVPLLPGELFSTWLSRAALAQGCDPIVLTGNVWPRWRAWTRDLDRGLSAERLDTLASRSGLCRLQLEEATLRPIIQQIAPDAVERKDAWPWVMAQGSRNRRRFGGLQYCPQCLTEDGMPYFRRHWRLAWHTGCERHGCLLADHCGNCRAPVEPHRCRAMDGVQTRCPSCSIDLRATRTDSACHEALAFQQAADAVLVAGRGSWAGATLQPPAWFAAARTHAGGRLRLLATDPNPQSLTALRLILQRPSERTFRVRMACRGMRGHAKGDLLRRTRYTVLAGSRHAPVPSSASKPPLPRAPAKVQGDWLRLLRRLRVGQP